MLHIPEMFIYFMKLGTIYSVQKDLIQSVHVLYIQVVTRTKALFL